MQFQDGSLFPETMEKLVITAAPYGPEWLPGDFPEDIPVTLEQQIQKAVDCHDAGAAVVHVHAREEDGQGSKRLSRLNALLAGIRARVPDLILQVGGSISFAPEGEGAQARWLSDDTRHLLAEAEPAPDQVTIAVNTCQMNILEQMVPADLQGTSLAQPALIMLRTRRATRSRWRSRVDRTRMAFQPSGTPLATPSRRREARVPVARYRARARWTRERSLGCRAAARSGSTAFR